MLIVPEEKKLYEYQVNFRQFGWEANFAVVL